MENDIQMSAAELKKRMDDQQKQDNGFLLIDVREPEEFEIAKIPGAVLIPLRTIPEKFQTLNPSQEIILHCHHGMRSMQALHFLKSKGFTNLRNLDGGIEAWSDIDPSVARY